MSAWREDEVRDMHRRGLITAGERGDAIAALQRAGSAKKKDEILSALRRTVAP